jgi:hypothetical protein
MDIERDTALGVAFPDADFDGLDVTYDLVRLRLTESSGRIVHIDCVGWIHLSVGPFFDDSFATDGRLLQGDPRIDSARDAVADRYESGSPARNAREFVLLEVELDDGARVECIAGQVQVTFPNT